MGSVIPYFRKFLERWPSVDALAGAAMEEVLGEWAGLGYYARARNLHACARIVAEAGGFPGTIAGLRGLPGVGAYTAAAVGAIAFGLAAVPVDGNVERVLARVLAVETPLPRAKAELAALAQGFMGQAAAREAAGDFAQALFDLGATVCTPRAPECGACPWHGGCAAAARGIAGELPRRDAKAARPVRRGVVFVMLDADGNVALRRREARGLLGGMLELPGSAWGETPGAVAPPMRARWVAAGSITHVFTHFTLELAVRAARVKKLPAGFLVEKAAAARLPSVMRKALAAGLRGCGG